MHSSSPEWPARELPAQPPASCASSSDSVLLSNHVHNPPNSPTTSSLYQHTSEKRVLDVIENETEWQYSLQNNTHLIQDSSSSRSLKNWCRRCDSFSLARRPAAMLLILVKRPFTASRLSLTWEVSKALLAIRLSAWPLRSFRRSWNSRMRSVTRSVSDEQNHCYCGCK